MCSNDIERLILFTARLLWANGNDELAVYQTLIVDGWNEMDLTEDNVYLLIKAANILNSNYSGS